MAKTQKECKDKEERNRQLREEKASAFREKTLQWSITVNKPQLIAGPLTEYPLEPTIKEPEDSVL
jgi:hypothetical protein